MIKVACQCGKRYTADEQHAGRQTRCSSCGSSVRIPRTVSPTTDQAIHDSPAPPLSGNGNSPPTTIASTPPEMIGPYSITGVLGAGGMAEVRRAHDPSLDREIALKLFPKAIAPDEELLKRFLREAKSSARLNHPNVVTVYQISQTAEYVYLAMELVDGGSLEKCVRDNGPLPWEEATRAIRDAARGLAAAHEHGLVHRDIKPGNLLRNRNGTTKVADFGIARVQDAATQLTADATTLGTPLYMAPEQWKRKNVDFRTDIYSLACTYYFLLTGTPPFEALSAPVVGYQHANEPFPNAKEVVNSIPDRICSILAQGAAKRPGRRFRSAAEFADELDELLVAPNNSRGFGKRSRPFDFGSVKKLFAVAALSIVAMVTLYGILRFASNAFSGASRPSQSALDALSPVQIRHNIARNGGFEDDVEDGTPPHWALLSGKWLAVTDHLSINASERKAFLEVQPATIGELRQDISVDEHRELIDRNLLHCTASAYLQCQTPDTLEFVVEFRDRGNNVIATITSEEQSGHGRWHLCQFGGNVPASTRTVTARIISRVRRRAAYVDNFVLEISGREGDNTDEASTAAQAICFAELGKNLLSNGGCEDDWSPSDGIDLWQSISGSWHPSGSQHDLGNTVPEGEFFFSPGSCSLADLRQEVPVHSLKQSIDAGVAVCEISAFVTAPATGEPDTCQLLVEFRDANRVVLDYFLSDEVSNKEDWTEITNHRDVPAKTRFVSATLISRHNSETTPNKGFFDDICVIITAP